MVGSVAVRRGVNAIGEFLAGGEFAVFVLTLVLTWTAAMVALMLWPHTFSPAAAFAGSFRVWCFGYDPLTGSWDLSRMAIVVLAPLLLCAFVGLAWRRMVIDTLARSRWVLARWTGVSTLIVVSILLGVAKSEAARSAGGNSVADYQLIRESAPAPRFLLTDHNGTAYSPAPGRVTVVTAFYAHCEHTCPRIIEQGRQALLKANIDPSRIDMALITLDPERDTVELLKRKAHNLKLASNWHLLTGPSAEVSAILDRYNVARSRDESGNIGHSNLFYVIDAQGRLAFKIGLGTVQEVWLKQALELLLREGG